MQSRMSVQVIVGRAEDRACTLSMEPFEFPRYRKMAVRCIELADAEIDRGKPDALRLKAAELLALAHDEEVQAQKPRSG